MVIRKRKSGELMERLNIFRNEKGLTLVEVLAALTIIGIIVVGLLFIFPQMTKFNDKTNSKLEAMNLAKMELYELQSHPSKIEAGNLTYSKDGYLFEVTVQQDEATKMKAIQLVQVHIVVKKDDRVTSETIGFIQR